MHVGYQDVMARVARAREKGAAAGSFLYKALRHGSMSLEFYMPVAEDRQQAHVQDELYLVQSGSAVLVMEGARIELTAGDAAFVPAGADHCFSTFSDDFGTWVVFWGPKDGEAIGNDM